MSAPSPSDRSPSGAEVYQLGCTALGHVWNVSSYMTNVEPWQDQECLCGTVKWKDAKKGSVRP